MEPNMRQRKTTLIRQKEIASAARKLIVKYGSENVTIKKMALEIGVSDAAIYRHFKSKREILSFLIKDIEQTLFDDIDQNYDGNMQSTEILESIIMGHISFIEQRKGITFQVIAEIISYGDKALNKEVYLVIIKYISRIKEILSQGVKSGLIRSDLDLEATAKMFFGMTQGLVNLWALSQYKFNLEEEYRPMWKIFLSVIVP
jgi:AcrR family transcriptional regulator